MVQLVNQVGPGARYNVPITNSGTLYYSLLIQLQDITSLAAAKTDTHGGGSFNLGFNNAQTVGQAGQPTGYSAPIYYGNVTNSSGVSQGYILGIGRGTVGTGRFWETGSPHQVGDVLFVVASYQFVAGVSNDIVSLWINPDPASFGAGSPPTPTVIIDGVNNISPDPDVNGGSIQSFVFGNRNATTPNLMYADELRLGASWADVTGGSTAVVIPTLSILKQDASTVLLSWSTNSTGFVLQSANQLLNASTPWADLGGSATVSGSNYIQTDTITHGGMSFYRLRQ